MTGDQPTADCITALATMPDATLVDEAWLCQVFGRCRRSIRRAVARGELPAPITMFRRHSWTVGSIVRHVQARQDAAMRTRTELELKVAAMRP